jgi:hypothetical protein
MTNTALSSVMGPKACQIISTQCALSRIRKCNLCSRILHVETDLNHKKPTNCYYSHWNTSTCRFTETLLDSTSDTRTGEEFDEPADIAVISALADFVGCSFDFELGMGVIQVTKYRPRAAGRWVDRRHWRDRSSFSNMPFLTYERVSSGHETRQFPN